MKILFFVLFTTFCTFSNAFAAIAGVVLLSKGNATATNDKGIERPLKRRSKILEGDIVATAKNSKLQIRFIDKALLTLKAESRLNVSAYQMAKLDNESEEVVMDLITGGFRTITGSIGKGEKSAYTVNTPAASIGIRGTHYEIAQEDGKGFVMAVWEGGITVSNDQGAIDLGSGSDFNFVRVKEGEEPEGLEEPPSSLVDTVPATESTDEESNADEEESPEEDSTEESTEENSENTRENKDEEQSTTDDSDSDNKEDNNTSDESSSETDSLTSTDNTANNGVDTEDASIDNAKESEMSEELTTAEASEKAKTEEPFPEITVIPSPDVRFDDVEYSNLLQRPRSGILVNTDTGNIVNALIVQDETDSTALKVSVAGSQTGDNNLDTFTLPLTDSNNSELNNRLSNTEFVSWGKWNGAINLVDNTGATSTPNKQFYWLSVEAANLSSLRGSATFRGSEGIGDINGESIDSIAGNFDVNFANGAIENGNLNIAIPDQKWDITFDGSVSGASASMNNIRGNITGGIFCVDCVSGDIQGSFARPGDHFIGGFALDGNAGTSTASGVFSLKSTP